MGMKPPAIAAALALLLAGSCAGPELGAVLSGNASFRAGRYEEAASSYLSVRNRSWRGLVDYDLANVWARLGEDRAALSLYDLALREGDSSLAAAIAFNRGVLHYEQGRYAESYTSFREALRLDPRDAGARRNLELAFRAWKKESAIDPVGLSPAAATDHQGERSEELRLLRRLETGSWKPGSGAPSQGGGRDW